jgi:hypothetical protein
MAIAAGLWSAILVVAPVFLGSVSPAHAAVPLSFLALRKTDLPPAYKQSAGKSNSIQSDARDSKMSVATLRAHGWQGSYDATFDFKAPGVLGVEIDSGVGRFKSPGDAAWFFAYGLHHMGDQATKVKLRPLRVQGLGEQATGFTLTETYKKVPVEVVLLGFRRGSYLGSLTLTVGGPKMAPPVAQAEFYARVMDDRIRFS